MKTIKGAVLAAALAAFVLAGCAGQASGTGTPAGSKNSSAASNTEDARSSEGASQSVQSTEGSASEGAGRFETVSYSITYDGKQYDKDAYVYVPASYQASEPMNIFYLMHGSTGSGEQLAQTMAPLFDSWISDGSMEPMLVVFPTYYPDRSFVVSDYSEDYPLNHFFATQEVNELMKAVESRYTTYAEGTDEKGLAAGRDHRAFGGYSMGGVTTWDVLAYQAQYFAYYMPMAGDSWLDRVTDASDDQALSDLLTQSLRENGYSSDDFRIIAMVGGNDGTKYSMQPQIEALRTYQSDLITDDNLIYWENDGGGHSQQSLEAEVQHGVSYLFSK